MNEIEKGLIDDYTPRNSKMAPQGMPPKAPKSTMNASRDNLKRKSRADRSTVDSATLLAMVGTKRPADLNVTDLGSQRS